MRDGQRHKLGNHVAAPRLHTRRGVPAAAPALGFNASVSKSGILRGEKESNINAFLSDEAWAFHEYHNRGGHDEVFAALHAAS